MQNRSTETQYYNNAPGIGKLYETVLPALGHDASGAFLDLLDNSDDAQATRMEIKILTDKIGLCGYVIIDNGVGMDILTLIESYRFATNTSHYEGDLGKFGVGGTIASFTLANKKTTLTKRADGELLVGEQDLKWFEDPEHDPTMSCMVREPTDEEREQFEKHCGNHGTMIILSDLKKQQYTRAGDLKNRLLKDIGTVFYEKIGSDKKIYVTYKGRQYRVRPNDPLYFNDKSKLLHSEKHTISFNDCDVDIKISQVDLDKLDMKDRSSEKQGLYIKRNGRLIMMGIADQLLWKKNPRFNSGRVEISFTEDLDEDFQLTATKNKVNFTQALKDKLWEPIKKFRSKMDKEWKVKQPTNSQEISIEEKAFSEMLQKSAGILDLPKSPDAPIYKKPENKGEGGKRTPTGEKRNSKPRGRMVPNFKMETHPRVREHFWIEGFDDNQMIIVINTANEFIKQFYLKGDRDTKRALRIEWAAQCLSEWSYYDTNDYDLVVSHRERTSEKITRIHNAVN